MPRDRIMPKYHQVRLIYNFGEVEKIWHTAMPTVTQFRPRRVTEQRHT